MRAPRPPRPHGGALALVHAAVVLVLGIAVLAGCTSTAGTSSSARVGQPENGPVAGYTVSIPKLGVSSGLVGLGLNPDHSIQVPALDNPMQAGVYTNGPMPGQKGPAVILAHVNAHGQQGFGAGLATLAAGDEIDATTPGGPVRYRVTRTDTVAKTRFPTAAVYSDTPGPELRLITCGGALDRTAHTYAGQTIVWATQT